MSSGVAGTRAKQIPYGNDKQKSERDGEDAAWELEVTRVLFAISVVDGAIRRHLLKALQGYAAKSGCTIAAAGMLAEQRWHEYNDASVVRSFYPRPRTFFGEGLWLRPQAWRCAEWWLRDVRLKRDAATGAAWRN